MMSIRRKGLRRAGKRGVRRMVTRLVFRLAKPYIPGVIATTAAGYFLDGKDGSARRQKALGLVGSLKK